MRDTLRQLISLAIYLAGPVSLVMPSTAVAIDAGDIDDGGWSDGGAWTDSGSFADGGQGHSGGQDGGVDGGEACSASCDGDTLIYCDSVTGQEYTIDCTDIQARCGLMSESWGMDCLLNENASCVPLYAEGRSRCDPAVPLFCNAGTCERTPGEEIDSPNPPSSAGGIGDVGNEEEHPFACLGCDDSDMPDIPFSLLFFGLGLRKLHRKQRKPRL